MNRIDSLFERLRSENRPALMPFLTAGDPDLKTTAALLRAVFDHGADLIEVGIPYSDPIADGPVIAESYTRALARHTTLDAIFQTLEDLRKGPNAASEAEPPIEAPMVTMVSYSIVHRKGVDRYLDRASEAGVDGLIVPDLPVEEAEDLLPRAADRNLKLIQLITPTTPRARAEAIARVSSGFIYYVSVAGTTGERKEVPKELPENIAWLRTVSELPICVGFGISRAEHVRALAPIADGLIVGSALVRRIAAASPERVVSEASAFVRELAQALTSP